MSELTRPCTYGPIDQRLLHEDEEMEAMDRLDKAMRAVEWVDVSHNLGTRNVVVSIYDAETYETALRTIVYDTVNSISVRLERTRSWVIVVHGNSETYKTTIPAHMKKPHVWKSAARWTTTWYVTCPGRPTPIAKDTWPEAMQIVRDYYNGNVAYTDRYE